MPGKFENIPLVPSIACEIITDLFAEKSIWKKSEIDTRVDQIHRAEGGIPGKQPLAAAVKKALQDLQADGLIVTRYNHWHLREKNQIADEVIIDEKFIEQLSELQAESEDSVETELVAEKEIGDGDESVYVFFNPNDCKLAQLEGRTKWECKVGKTSASDSLARVFSLRTALSHQPVVGLIIKTQDSSALEKALHSALRLVDAAVPDSPGVEWFMTSPTRVEKWYCLFQQSLAVLSEPENAK